MFGIGGFELFIILVFGFLIFGPDKLPEIAKTVGKGIARFREAQQEMNETLGNEKLIDLDNPDEPFKNPIDALDRIAQRQEEKRAGASASSTQGAGMQQAAAAASAVAAAKAQGQDDTPKQESFTERKARYERERAARKAAEAEAAKAAAEAKTQVVAEKAPAEAAPAAEPVADAAPASQAPETPDVKPAAQQAIDASVSQAFETADAPAKGGDE